MNKHYNKRWIEQRWASVSAGSVKAHPIETAAERKKEGCGSEAEHGNCRVLPDHA